MANGAWGNSWGRSWGSSWGRSGNAPVHIDWPGRSGHAKSKRKARPVSTARQVVPAIAPRKRKKRKQTQDEDAVLNACALLL